MNEFMTLNECELLVVDGGGILSKIGGTLITVGGVIATGANPVSVGIGVISLITVWI